MYACNIILEIYYMFLNTYENSARRNNNSLTTITIFTAVDKFIRHILEIVRMKQCGHKEVVVRVYVIRDRVITVIRY